MRVLLSRRGIVAVVAGTRGSRGGLGVRIALGTLKVMVPSSSMKRPPPPAPPGIYLLRFGGGSERAAALAPKAVVGVATSRVGREEVATGGLAASLSRTGRVDEAVVGVDMRSRLGRLEMVVGADTSSSSKPRRAVEDTDGGAGLVLLRLAVGRRGVAGLDAMSSASVSALLSVFRVIEMIGMVNHRVVGGGAETRDAA